jgi:hypothetical protein
MASERIASAVAGVSDTSNSAGGDPALDHLPEGALDRQPHRRHGTEVGRLEGR